MATIASDIASDVVTGNDTAGGVAAGSDDTAGGDDTAATSSRNRITLAATLPLAF